MNKDREREDTEAADGEFEVDDKSASGDRTSTESSDDQPRRDSPMPDIDRNGNDDRRHGPGNDDHVDPIDDVLGSDVDEDMPVDKDIAEDDLLGGLKIESSDEIEVPDRLVDQVIGQDHAREIVLKAAKQRRHVMMIGSPGTGKSMLAKAMSQLLPKEELQDVLVYHNPDDGNEPKVRTVPAGKGEQIVDAHKEEARKRNQMKTFIMWVIIALVLGYALIIARQLLLGILAAGIVYLAFRYASRGSDAMVPNLIVNAADQQTAPFEDATGAHAGALLGDVRHDPFQSGGMETPSHDRV
ncbi:MAG: ATP-binding protein, partial [Halovenus sp.]